MIASATMEITRPHPAISRRRPGRWLIAIIFIVGITDTRDLTDLLRTHWLPIVGLLIMQMHAIKLSTEIDITHTCRE